MGFGNHPSPRRRRLAVVATAMVTVLLATFAQTGVNAATGAPVTVVLDGRDISAGLPVRVERGYVLMPVRTLAEALGASLYWEGSGDGTGIVRVFSYPRTFSPLGFAAAYLQRSWPDMLGAMGAASTLTQYLAAEQASSLSGTGPAVVRFDLIDLTAHVVLPPPDDLTKIDVDGYRFAVRLYYVQFKDQTAPAFASQWRRVSGPGASVGSFTPEVTSSWYEDVTFDVRPKGAPKYVQTGNVEVVTYGLEGWEVDPASRTELRKVTMVRTPYLIHGASGR